METDSERLGETSQVTHNDAITSSEQCDSPSHNVQTAAIPTEPNNDTSTPAYKPDFRVYAIVVGLGITNLLTAVESTIVSTAAPAILTDLQLGVNFIWITNAFFLSSTAIIPLCGQFCNVFGRRYVMLTAVAVFMLGSGISGGASTGGMLIAGRAVQGAGSGGIMMLTSIIVSDLVPLRQRGNMAALLISIFGVGAALGPFIGGVIVSSTTWRWIFYLNLPIGGAALVILFVFLRVGYSKDLSFWQKLKRVDFAGNAILVASTVSVLYALSYAGTLYFWGSWHTLVPLVLGLFGLVLFTALQGVTSWAEPLMPLRFFQARTSVILAMCTFIHSALLFWSIFFLPVFFQGVKLYSPRQSGAGLLPISLIGVPGSILGAVALTRWGRYKAIHILAFALLAIGLGLLTLQDEGTPIPLWVVFQSIFSVGFGLAFSTILPAFQAFAHESDVASCTAAWYFIRLFGHVWGVAIPGAVFNSRINDLIAQGAISDPEVARSLSAGAAYQVASAAFVGQLMPALKAEVRAVFRQATQRVFQVAIIFAGVGFLLSLLEKEIKLRKTLDTDFGLENKKDERNRVEVS
ncbi:MFS general substrate transporter [Nemania sp. FL0916]|nr:MFS general substrate transporter [Nemania sp. FL0916]